MEKIIKAHYHSPIGWLELTDAGGWLVKCCFVESDSECESEPATPVLQKALDWLDRYFSGADPGKPDFPMRADGTEFRKRVWDALSRISYGNTKTYGEVARMIGSDVRSSRAVGNACGANNLILFIPCHRVTSGSGLGGYTGGGPDVKRRLLSLEAAHKV